MNLIDTRRKEIQASRWGNNAASREHQAECAVIGHVFVHFKPSKSDPFGQRGTVSESCIYCGWKE